MKHSRFLSAVCLYLFVGILLLPASRAGFIEDGVPIIVADGEQTSPLIVSCPEGGAIISWVDRRAVSGTALMAQKIDGSGRYQWAMSGVPISASPSTQVEEAIISDGSGGVFVAWKRNEDIYAQHIDASGTPQWTADGIPVCAAGGEQQRPGLCLDSGDGIIVCWLDSRSGAKGIYAQRISGAGIPIWTVDGVVVHDVEASTLKVCSDGQGGAIIAYDCAGLRTQRVRSDGTVAWASGGIFVWDNEFNHILRGVEYDNRFGAIIFWEARLAFEAYTVAMQHVDSTGTSRYGLRQTSWSGYDGGWSPSVAVDDDGGYILAYLEWPYHYAQRTDRIGDHKWTTIVCFQGEGYGIRAASDGRRGAHFVFGDNRDGFRIYSQHIDSLGTRSWPDEGIALAPGSAKQGGGVICPDGSNGAIMAWVDYREGDADPDIYAGSINSSGEIVATLLAGFDVRAGSSGVIVSWTLSEIDRDARFGVSRCTGPEGLFVPLDGHVECDGLNFSFTDNECEAGESYRYRVVFEYGGEEGVLFETDEITLPAAEAVLYQNAPNPFNPSTAITFSLPARQHVRITVYDVAGRLVSLVADEVAGAGKSTVYWDGTDTGGTPVTSGVYFCRLVAGKSVLTRKMTLLR